MKSLSHYIQEAQTEILERLGGFFAFSQSQLDEQKKEGVEYASGGFGLIAPKDNMKELLEGLENIYKLGVEKDKAENGLDKIIKRELANHEAYYTNSIQQTFNAISDYGVTYEQVLKIFKVERLTAEI